MAADLRHVSAQHGGAELGPCVRAQLLCLLQASTLAWPATQHAPRVLRLDTKHGLQRSSWQ